MLAALNHPHIAAMYGLEGASHFGYSINRPAERDGDPWMPGTLECGIAGGESVAALLGAFVTDGPAL